MPYDIWTAYQFDSAVSYFGVWIENKLNEMDWNRKPPRPKYKLKDLLSDAPVATAIPIEAQPGVPTSMSSIRRRVRNKRGPKS